MKALSIIVALCVLGFVAYRMLIGGSTESWHQRLTIIIDTPAGEVRGSSVVEVITTESSGALIPMEARGVQSDVRGEAVAVEAAPGQWLFALLDGPVNSRAKADQLVHSAFDLRAGTPVRERSYANNMAALHAIPLDTPAPLPPESYPMLVTFDDIARPETVRQVDPDDLDGTLGCARSSGVTFPWRELGMTYRGWANGEAKRLSRDLASERAGLMGPVGDAITELYSINENGPISDVDEARLAVLHPQFDKGQRYQWLDARQELKGEVLASLPTAQSLTADVGGPCFTLKQMTLEITEEAVTVGQVRGVLGWLCAHRTEPNLSWTNGQTEKNALAKSLNTGDFSVGVCG